MTASAHPTGPSLLPYVTLDAPGLHLRLVAGQTAPLSTMKAAGPFAAIVEAQVAAGGGDGIGDLFLLIQPDQYALVPSELAPLTNRDVDALWQSALQTTTARQNRGPWLFPEQLDAQGRLVPWRSLFFCTATKRHGHALCPHCGAGLTVCRNDPVLQDAGLPLYSASLSRFLYCPACLAEAGAPRFYAREAPEDPPPCLMGGEQLIRGFGRLLDRQDLAAELPCVGCAQALACHGPEMRIQERMIPLFFFPFHMLTQPAPTLNLIDFLPLLSGADTQEISRNLAPFHKEGRLRKLGQCQSLLAGEGGLLFTGTHKTFAEVLYLKLTLLSDVWDTLIQDAAQLPEPVAAMSLESFWVTLPAQSARLPMFWNFSLELVDRIGRPVGSGASEPLNRAHGRIFMGTAWLHTLLVNQDQDMQTVQAAVDRHLANYPILDPLAPTPDLQDEKVFDAGNLFWRPSQSPPTEAPIDAQLLGLWHSALTLGFAVLQAGRTTDPSWSDATFRARLADLRQSLHGALFQPTSPAMPSADDQRPPEDEHIAKILRTIAAHWPQIEPEPKEPATPDAESAPADTPAPIPDGDGDYQETIILGPPAAYAQPGITPTEPHAAAGPSETAGLSEGTADDLEATILMDPGQAVGSHPPPPDPMGQTLIPTSHANDTGGQDDLEATVLMRPGAGLPHHPNAPASRSAGPQTTPGRPPAPPAYEDDDDLAQTVILRPEHKKEHKPKP